MNKLNEAIEKVFNDGEIKKMIESEVEKLSNEKAKIIAQNYIDILECEADDYLNKKVSNLVKGVSEVMNETIIAFTNKYKGMFDSYKDSKKSSAILEALATVCKIAGVNAEMITNEVNNIQSKNEKVLESKIECLKRLVNEEQTKSKNNKLQSEEKFNNIKSALSKKTFELNNLSKKLKETEDENVELKDINSELENEINVNEKKLSNLSKKLKETEDENIELKDINDELETELENKNITHESELQRLNDKIKEKEIENDELTEEKNNIAKLGIIAEIKQGLSLSESRDFEKNAISIPFSMDKSYINKLRKLKESIIEERTLNEVTDSKEDEDETEKWYNKYV